MSSRAAVPAPTFDSGSWRLEAARPVAAAAILIFAAVAWTAGGTAGRFAAPLLVLDVVVQSLPWRLPRSQRSIMSVCIEEAAYLLIPALYLVAVALQGDSWLLALPAPAWYVVGAGTGAGLIWLGGINLRALLSGVLGFLAPPLRRPHKLARAASTAIAPPGEEALFRGVPLAAGGTAGIALGLIAAAFVARHHLPAGLSRRTARRALVTQATSPRLWSGSRSPPDRFCRPSSPTTSTTRRSCFSSCNAKRWRTSNEPELPRLPLRA